MNCQKGDLAIIIKSYAGNEGKVVTCLEHIGSPNLPFEWEGKPLCLAPGDWWRVDRNLNMLTGGYVLMEDHAPFTRDEFLRPISGPSVTIDFKETEDEPA